MEKVIYTDRHGKEFSEEEAKSLLFYQIHYYDNDKLLKIEDYKDQKLSGLTIYLQSDHAYEELLYENKHIPNITIYHDHKIINGYHYYEVSTFTYLELTRNSIQILKNDRIVTEVWIYPEEYDTSYKYIYTAEKKLTFNYYDNGDLDKFNFEENSEIVPDNFYNSLFPLIPETEVPLPNRRVTYRQTYKGDEGTLTLREALNIQLFTKDVFYGDHHAFTELYENGILQERSVYLNSAKYSTDILNPEIKNIVYYNPTEINNYTVWDIDHYSIGLQLAQKTKEVISFSGWKFASQKLDILTGEVLETEKFSPDFNISDEDYDTYSYDKDGKPGKYNGDGDFSDSEYGDYLSQASPLVPQLKGPEKQIKKVVFRNHHGKIINETEIKHLYEYVKETYIGDFLNKVEYYGSYKDDEEFYDDIKDQEEIIAKRSSGICYYNLRYSNGYRIYDIYYYNWNIENIHTGTLVQDTYGREIVRALFIDGKLAEGRKTIYKDYLAYQYETEYNEQIGFNSNDEACSYLVQFSEIPKLVTMMQFEDYSNDEYIKISHPYYKSLKELIPPYPVLEKTELTKKTIYIKGYYSDNSTTKIAAFYNEDGKLKHTIADYYNTYYLSDDEDLKIIQAALSPFEYRNFYYNIKRNDNIISAIYAMGGTEIFITINLEDFSITATNDFGYELVKCIYGPEDTESYLYQFKLNDLYIHIPPIHVKHLSELLMQAL